MDPASRTQNEAVETSELLSCSKPPSPTPSSPSASSECVPSPDSQSALIEDILPQRPGPVLSTDSLRTASYYGTTACTTPSRWSLSDKVKDSIDIQEVLRSFQNFL